jgi:hypothetical protein
MYIKISFIHKNSPYCKYIEGVHTRVPVKIQ